VSSSVARGFTVFLTGLSGAGKSTLAAALTARLHTAGRLVSILDGDVVRQHLGGELGYSREHRDLHVGRVGFVATEITRCGGVAVCAVIAPYDGARRAVRRSVEGVGGGFLLVHVATPLEVCESRDPKGLYAKARAGLVAHFTGISAPYELPRDADLVIDTTLTPPDVAADQIIVALRRRRYLPPSRRMRASPVRRTQVIRANDAG
jgi:sulfate adenylyltransferase